MARYIDADKFAEAICNFPAIDEHSANAVISLLHRHPTADVVEVKHGEWVKSNPHNRFMDCSACGFFQDHTEFNYCPNCGAKMKGGGGK